MEIRVLVIRPGEEPQEDRIEDSLESLQEAVGGLIECTYPFDDNAFVIGNEEAKLIGMKGNRMINGSIYAGTILIAGDNGCGETIDLTDEQVAKYAEMFEVPDKISDEEVQADCGYTMFFY